MEQFGADRVEPFTELDKNTRMVEQNPIERIFCFKPVGFKTNGVCQMHLYNYLCMFCTCSFKGFVKSNSNNRP